MSSIDQLTKDFTGVLEWQHFASAQQKTITQLTKQLDKAEKENVDLHKLLESQVPLLGSKGTLTVFEEKALELNKQGMGSAEIICHLEINKLKEISLRQQLTTEEIRNLESLIKSLKALSENKKKDEREVNSIETSSLLDLIEGNSELK